MLSFELTPHHAGVVLWGDFETLHKVYEFVHRVVDGNVFINDEESFVLGLAYDMRKAFEGQRSSGYRAHSETKRTPIYGVEVLWPVLLVQVALLRRAMAFMVTGKLDQAVIFELEYVVESALQKALPQNANHVINTMNSVGSANYAHLDGILDSRCRYFIELPADQRLVELPMLMESFDPLYGIGVGQAIPPDAFAEYGDDLPHPDVLW